MAKGSADVGELRAELEDCSRRARELCAGRSPVDLGRRADPKRWSIAEQLEHLSLTSESFLAPLDGAARELEQRGERGDRPLRTELVGRAMLWYLEPPYRSRMPTTPPFVPAPDSDPTAALPRFLRLQDQVAQRIERWRGLPLDRAKIASPFNAKLKYSAWTGLRLLPCHQRRHLWSAERAHAG